MNIAATQKITIKYHYLDSTTEADKKYLDNLLCKFLEREYEDIEWCMSDTGTGCITAIETAPGNFYPGCRYTSNGDGYPDEWEIEYAVWENDLDGLCMQFSEDHPNFIYDQCTCDTVDTIYYPID